MSDLNLSMVENCIANLSYPTNAFIGGDFVPAMSGKTIASISPITGEEITEYASCDKEDVDKAVSIAKKTFESGVWSKMHPTERKKVLLKYADIIEKHTLELAVLESLDSGKPVSDCYTIDVPEGVHAVRWHAEYADKNYGQASPSGDGAVGIVVKEAIGVVACIIPWNFPLMTTMWKLAPSLAEGNSIIIKPASVTTLSTLLLVKFAAEAGIPEGVIQVITGSGSVVGEALGMHPDVGVISFTGSTEIGRKLLEYSSKSNLKKIVLELGGKSPMVIMDDVKDLTNAVDNALFSSFWNAGQSCTANSRIFVPKSRQDEFVELMIQRMDQTWRIGNPLDPQFNYGTMIGKFHYDQVMGYMNTFLAEGHNLAYGGKSLTIGQGLFIQPTIFVDPEPSSDLMTTELFGPITSVIGVNSNEEAVAMANNVEYGLQATIFTDNLVNTFKYARAIKAGTVSINRYCEGDITTPFGGLKMSGFGGQDNAGAAHDQYTEIKTIFADLTQSSC